MRLKIILSVTATLAIFSSALASETSYDQIRTAIFGAGNPAAGWTIDSDGVIEVGLRAKNRSTGSTVNDFGTYYFASAPATRGLFNYEFHINSDLSGAGVPLSEYEWHLAVDQDSSQGTLFVIVSPFENWADNSFGNNATAVGAGVEPASLEQVIAFPETYNIAQNSQNITFGDYPGGALPLEQNATYDFQLYATVKGTSPNSDKLVSVGITVVVGLGGAPVTAETHGEYVASVAAEANQMVEDGSIDKKQRGEIISAAARSK